ncbi:MAG: hypothetical protein BMS9Abin11_0233 [Gammaproteobacteria bacterium]|nr:MAG: hypothetical protein BMS9Abin11_0233 [Gammaproteobacteria bacterium]
MGAQLCMTYRMGKYCQIYGFNEKTIGLRLDQLGFLPGDKARAAQLTDDVLNPYCHQIIDQFYDTLAKFSSFQQIMARGFDVANLKKTQTQYLQTLGKDYDQESYFERRLRIGVVHDHVGVPLSLYASAYRLMTQLIIDTIPGHIKNDVQAYTDMIQYLLRITTLDMTLAIETYHISKLHGLEESLDIMRHEDERLRRMIDTDRLTSVASRDNILLNLEQAIRQAQIQGLPLCLIMADLDHFKDVNDNYGHQAGDYVLADIAARILAGVRETDMVGRYGGEEFMVLLRNTSLDTARIICERIRQRVGSSPIHLQKQKIPMTISQGLVMYQRGESMDHFIGRSDKALYAAKEAGRDCVIVHNVQN